MAEQQQQQEPSPQQAAGVQSSEEAPGDQEPKVRYSGVVKWFNATKGFGFITPRSPEAGSEDLFVHQSNISATGFRSLREGEDVCFDLEAAQDGRNKAINVTGPGGSPPLGALPRTRTAPMAGGRGRGRGQGVGLRPEFMGPPPGHGFGFPGPVQPQLYFGYYTYPGAPPPGDYAGLAGRGRGRGGPQLIAGRGPPGMMGPGGHMMLAPPHAYMQQGPMTGMPSQPQLGGPQGQSTGLQVVVHNLPWNCTWQQLKDCFREWKVDRADIVEDAFGRSRGFGTVRFSTPEDAAAACAKNNNMVMDGRTVSVRIDRFA